MTRTFKKLINILLALFMITALILMSGCNNQQQEAEEEEMLPVVNEITLTTYNDFALNLLKNTRQADENIIISPILIGTTMTMLRMGANGNTAEQIDELMGMTITDYDLVASQCAQIVSRLDTMAGIRYETGMGLYLDEGPAIREEYAVMAEENFGLDIEFLNFSGKKTVVDINDWADIETTGLVETIITQNEINDEMLALLINVNGLDCEWEVSFDPTNTRPLPFAMYDGRNVAVPMMRGRLSMNYYEDENVTAAFIPLSGREVSLAIILPSEDQRLDEFIDGLTAEDIELWRYISVESERYLNIPKIDWQQKLRFKSTLSNMGAGSIFEEETADFTDLGSEFYLTDMWQTTIITAVEDGEAEPNVTAIDLTRAKGQGEEFFSINRPFLFAVIENETGGILMTGTMTNPLEKNTYLTEE